VHWGRWASTRFFFRPGREGQHVIVETTRIVGDAVDGVFPSDHRAVVADLRRRG
jgi:hypothetical protein